MAASTMRYDRGPGPATAVALLLIFGALSGVGIAMGEVEAMLAFMAEPITVRIEETSDMNADQVFEFIINGKNYDLYPERVS